MIRATRILTPALGAIVLTALLSISAQAQATGTPRTSRAEQSPTLDLLKGLRSGELAVKATGTGDGRMTLAITNRSDRPIRVVLPSRLIASGATGQFGGGGFGGMGGGGFGGGMGGMGGGMGGMGGMGD